MPRLRTSPAPGLLTSRVPAGDDFFNSLHPMLDAIAARWSPRAFDPGRPLNDAELLPLLEAARWAASSSNLQP